MMINNITLHPFHTLWHSLYNTETPNTTMFLCTNFKNKKVIISNYNYFSLYIT